MWGDRRSRKKDVQFVHEGVKDVINKRKQSVSGCLRKGDGSVLIELDRIEEGGQITL